MEKGQGEAHKEISLSKGGENSPVSGVDQEKGASVAIPAGRRVGAKCKETENRPLSGAEKSAPGSHVGGVPKSVTKQDQE